MESRVWSWQNSRRPSKGAWTFSRNESARLPPRSSPRLSRIREKTFASVDADAIDASDVVYIGKRWEDFDLRVRGLNGRNWKGESCS